MVLGSVKAPEQGEDMQNEQEDRGGTQGFPLKPVLALLTSMVALALGTSLAKQLFPLIGARVRRRCGWGFRRWCCCWPRAPGGTGCHGRTGGWCCATG